MVSNYFKLFVAGLKFPAFGGMFCKHDEPKKVPNRELKRAFLEE